MTSGRDGRGTPRGLLACVLGALAATVVAAVTSPGRLLEAWLFSFLVVWMAGVGSIGVATLHDLTGGRWGDALRPFLDGAARSLPVLALLFLPVLLGMRHLYAWSDPGAAAADAADFHRQPYLNVPFFVARAAVYFVVWWGLARRVVPAGPAMLLFAFSVAFASIDWLQSVDPSDASSMHGFLAIVGHGLTALVAGAAWLSGSARTPAELPRDDWDERRRDAMQDVGSLVFTAVLLFAYVAFSEYLLLWAGNTETKAAPYAKRIQGVYGWAAAALVGLHFAVPTTLLLFRRARRTSRVLLALAGGLLAARFLDAWWRVRPAFPAGPAVHWVDVTTPFAVGGVWLLVVLRAIPRPTTAGGVR